MATSDYRKAFEEAAGDKAKYMELCKDLPERHRNTATILWCQFNREIEVRQCICANGGEVVNFLKHLPLSHMDFTVKTTYSEDVDSGLVIVSSDPIAKVITIIGATVDV